jgi:hypothetical protein
VTCPTGVSVWLPPNSQSAAVTWQVPTFTDNVKLLTSTVNLQPGNYSAGTYTVSATATDSSGNEAACSFVVTVNADTTPPVISPCPVSQTVALTGKSNTVVVTWPTPTVTDNTAVLGMVYSPQPYQSGASFPLGSTAMILQAADIYANTAKCAFTIRVVDQTPPVRFVARYWTKYSFDVIN